MPGVFESKPVLTVVIPTHNNAPVFARCLAAWRACARNQNVEIIAIVDGCTDHSDDVVAAESRADWGRSTFRAIRADNEHELLCTNRGIAAASAPLVMSWHDDMFVRVDWLVGELVDTMTAYPEIGLLCLSRGLTFRVVDEPIRTLADTMDWRRVQSTIGSGPWNWLRLKEVHAVIRPWVLRRECAERVGMLDEAFRPTEWDEADLSYRLREAGWRVATYGYERLGAYDHLMSTTFGRNPSAWREANAVRNATLFFSRWRERIQAEADVPLRSWRRRIPPSALPNLVRSLVTRGIRSGRHE